MSKPSSAPLRQSAYDMKLAVPSTTFWRLRRSVDDASGPKAKSAAGETAAEFEKRVQ